MAGCLEMDLMISVLPPLCINATILICEWINVQLPYPATPSSYELMVRITNTWYSCIKIIFIKTFVFVFSQKNRKKMKPIMKFKLWWQHFSKVKCLYKKNYETCKLRILEAVLTF